MADTEPTYSSDSEDKPLASRKKVTDSKPNAGTAESKKIPKKTSARASVKPDTSANAKPAAKGKAPAAKPSTSKAAPAQKPAEKGKKPEDAKEKKVYDLPGQKRDPPEPTESLYKFYTSLRVQKPSSEMAEVWLMEHGLLPYNEAKAALDAINKRKAKARGLPASSSKPKPKDNGSAKKRAADADDFQDSQPIKKKKTSK